MADPMKLPPQRLTIEKGKAFHNPSALRRGVRVAIDGVERVNEVVEYCVYGRWARLHVRDAEGKNVPNVSRTAWAIRKVDGAEIVVWWKDAPVPPGVRISTLSATPSADAPAVVGAIVDEYPSQTQGDNQ